MTYLRMDLRRFSDPSELDDRPPRAPKQRRKGKSPELPSIRPVVECHGKDALTQQRAREIADRMRRRDDRGSRIGAYCCKTCGHWHVGSTPTMLKTKGRQESRAELRK